MIDMLANILSKDLVLFATVQGVFFGVFNFRFATFAENLVSDSVSQARSAVDVAMYGLQMLLPLIDMQLLRHPTLCNGCVMTFSLSNFELFLQILSTHSLT